MQKIASVINSYITTYTVEYKPTVIEIYNKNYKTIFCDDFCHVRVDFTESLKQPFLLVYPHFDTSTSSLGAPFQKLIPCNFLISRSVQNLIPHVCKELLITFPIFELSAEVIAEK